MAEYKEPHRKLLTEWAGRLSRKRFEEIINEIHDLDESQRKILKQVLNIIENKKFTTRELSLLKEAYEIINKLKLKTISYIQDENRLKIDYPGIDYQKDFKITQPYEKYLPPDEKLFKGDISNSTPHKKPNIPDMDNPVIDYTDGSDPEKDKSVYTGTGRVEIFYGTNRNINDKNILNRYYGSKVDQLHYGTCVINIPKNHKAGEIERPWAIFGWEIERESDKHVRLKEIKEFDRSDFCKKVNETIKKLDDKSALVFVHGYNNSFAEAAWRTGQFAWDLPFKGITALFSWPSAGKSASYFADIERADESVNALKIFLRELIINAKVEKLHLVAHSMGSRVVTSALKEIKNDPDLSYLLKLIDNIILAAPDLDQKVFKENLLPYFKSIGKTRTLYASEKDKALNLAEKLRGGRARLGDGGSELFITEGIDTIDASDVKSWGNHHSYVFETHEVLSDMFYLFTEGFGPERRRLSKQSRNDLNYWLFKY